jgi:hypothetical protein
MKSEKPRRKGQNASGFQWIPSGIPYTPGNRTVHQRIKREKREEDAADSKIEDALGL